MEFFQVKTVKEVWDLFREFEPLSSEEISLEEGLGRVLYEDVFSPEDFPPFPRSTVDGYAVKSSSTFGASSSFPVPFRVIGEVKMGEAPSVKLREEETVSIPTGGLLPEGADAVVMVEYTRKLGPSEIEVLKAVSPGENVMDKGEDFQKGELLLERGRRLKAQDLGICAAIGLSRLKVFKRPKVGIISTGDEIVPVELTPKPGQIRNSNSYVLRGLVEQEGGIPLYLGHSGDEVEELFSLLKKGLEKELHMILISGGSSVGARDVTLLGLKKIGAEVLVHGVAINPGKPTLLAQKDGIPIFGLPGHPASCAIVAMVLMVPLLRRIGGERAYLPPFRLKLRAFSKKNIPSPSGREDYVRVILKEEGGKLWAEPIFSKSGALLPLVKANGLLFIEAEKEGVSKGEEVTVFPL
jgi:molybdopterin molybdotransferase